MSDHKKPHNRFLGDIDEIRADLKPQISSDSYNTDLSTVSNIKSRLKLHKAKVASVINPISLEDGVEKLQTLLDTSSNDGVLMILYSLERTGKLQAVLPKLTLLGLDLSNILMTSLQCEELDLSGTMIREGCFQDSDLRRANFRNVIFERTVFDNCLLEASTFEGAKLTSCWLGGNMNNAIFTNSVIHNSTITGSSQHANFAHADLRGTRLRELNIYGCDFREANLLGALRDGVYIDSQVIWPDGTKYHPLRNSGTHFFRNIESDKGVER